jgi:hypothetical protein
MDDLDPLSSEEISSILLVEKDGWNCSEWVCPGTVNNYDAEANSSNSVDSNKSDGNSLDHVVGIGSVLNSVENEYIRRILRNIKKYWSRGSFLGHDTFRDTMLRTCFQEFRSSVRFCSLSSHDSEAAVSDPLWFC